MNIFALLFDVIPVKYRRYAYTLATILLFVYGVWQASDGDWKTFAGSLASALVTALAAGNSVPVGTEAEPPLDEDPDDEMDTSGLPDAQYPITDESGPDAEFPNSETLYQPGEKEGERFLAETNPNPVSGNDPAPKRLPDFPA